MRIGIAVNVGASGNQTITPTFAVESAEDITALLVAAETNTTLELAAGLITRAEEAAEKEINAARRALRAIKRQLACAIGNNGREFWEGESLDAQIVGMSVEGEFIQEQVVVLLAKVKEAGALRQAATLWREKIKEADLSGSRRFKFDGREVTFAELLADNADDGAVLAWMPTAEVGAVFPGVPFVQRIA